MLLLIFALTGAMTAFDTRTRRNRIETLIGEMPGALPIPQDVRVSAWSVTGQAPMNTSRPLRANEIYAFVAEGEVSCGDMQLGPNLKPSMKSSISGSFSAPLMILAAKSTVRRLQRQGAGSLRKLH